MQRLMRDLGISGVVRGKPRRTTVAANASERRPADLDERRFAAPAPNRLWVADLTYVRTWSGFAYVAFVIDVYARVSVGCGTGAYLRASRRWGVVAGHRAIALVSRTAIAMPVRGDGPGVVLDVHAAAEGTHRVSLTTL